MRKMMGQPAGASRPSRLVIRDYHNPRRERWNTEKLLPAKKPQRPITK